MNHRVGSGFSGEGGQRESFQESVGQSLPCLRKRDRPSWVQALSSQVGLATLQRVGSPAAKSRPSLPRKDHLAMGLVDWCSDSPGRDFGVAHRYDLSSAVVVVGCILRRFDRKLSRSGRDPVRKTSRLLMAGSVLRKHIERTSKDRLTLFSRLATWILTFWHE